MARSDNIPRLLIIQDQDVVPEAVLRVQNPSSGASEERGLEVDQADETSSTLVGDIRPALSGVPDRDSGAELRVLGAGVEGNVRWGWVKDGADADTDLQLRQKVGVCGRAPKVIERDATGAAHLSSPVVLSLVDGDALALWMSQDVAWPNRSPAAGWATTFRVSRLSHTTGAWGAAADADGLGDWETTKKPAPIEDGPYWTDFDVVEYEDTEELVALVMGVYTDTKGDEFPIGATYGSTDGGLTWVMRSPIFLTGIGALRLQAGRTDEGILCCAMSMTETGRLVAAFGQQRNLAGMASDDRGNTWTGQDIESIAGSYATLDASPQDGSPYQCLTLRRARNGVIFGVWHLNAQKTGQTAVSWSLALTTVDGSSWSAAAATWSKSYAMTSVEAFIRPDGWPWMVGTYHNAMAYDAPTVYDEAFDELAWQNFFDIDLLASSDRDPTPPVENTPGWATMHPIVDVGNGGTSRPNAPGGVMWKPTDDPPVLDGWSGVSAVEWRGQVLIVGVVESDADSLSALVALRSDHFQPLQELLDPVLSDSFPTLTAVDRALGGCYHRCWDYYDDPANWGFLRVSGGGLSVDAYNAEGWGIVTTAGSNRYFRDSSLPFANANHEAVVRGVVRPMYGGGLGADYMALRCVLTNATTAESVGGTVRMEVSGSDVVLQLFDAYSGASAGPSVTLTGAAEKDVEIIMAFRTDGGAAGATKVNVRAYCRLWAPSTDPDWDEGYEYLDDGLLSLQPAAGEGVDFGHCDAAVVDTYSLWKAVQTWRSDVTNGTTYRIQLRPRGTDYVEDESLLLRTSTAAWGLTEDDGVRTYMRAAQGVAYPAQHIADGVRVSWRGEALAAGGIEYSTRRIYAAKHLFDQSTPQRKWLGVGSASARAEIVLDAELSFANATWDVSAIAVVGKNWPRCRIQFNATDVWTAPAVDLALGIPGATAYLRGLALWSADPTLAGWSMTVDRYRLTYQTASSAARGNRLFRPHRFASKATGPEFFVCFYSAPSFWVYRILDNDADTLYLDGDPLADGISATQKSSIISDRFAWDFSAHLPATRYRYMRLLIDYTSFKGTDDGLRAGSIILGKATQLGPGIVYGYGEQSAPGSVVSVAETGASFRRRNHSMVRSWTLDAPAMLPANMPDSRTYADIHQAAWSWEKIMDALRRVEVDGEVFALAFDGDPVESTAADSAEAVLVDPMDLALVRLSDAGSSDQLAYWGRTVPEIGAAGATHCRPRDIRQVRRIAMTEIL